MYERLVEQKRERIAEQRASESDALPLPTREFPRKPRQVFLDMQGACNGIHALDGYAAAHPKAQIFANVHRHKKRVFLKDERDSPTVGGKLA